MNLPLHRRQFLKKSLATLGAFAFAVNLPTWATRAAAGGAPVLDTNNLLPPDKNGVMLPPGFTSRIIAQSGQRVTSQSSYLWHAAPDGGAVFPIDNSGWIYVSNSEMRETGGVGALKFDGQGNITNAYSILQSTNRNCAGGATPWGTWLSCEEVDDGYVWECDPLGKYPAQRLGSLGVFRHEAAAVDPLTQQIYLTEDQPDGLFYRFTPEKIDLQNKPSLDRGVLEAAVIVGTDVTWEKVPNPSGGKKDPTRKQVPNGTVFKGGEGAAYKDGHVYFSTKEDNRIWVYNIADKKMGLLYDIANSEKPILSGVDNIALSPRGDVIVAEDGGNMELVGLRTDAAPYPLLRVIGHDKSEITGPAFSPDGTRLYFSSQRGHKGEDGAGITFEISGPFDHQASLK